MGKIQSNVQHLLFEIMGVIVITEKRNLVLDNLPKNGNQIDWKNSSGYIVPFTYDNIDGEIEILKYYRKGEIGRLIISYKSKLYHISTSNFKNGNFAILLEKRKMNHLYFAGDILENQKSGRLKILEQVMLTSPKRRRGYSYECLICGNVDVISEVSLSHKSGCNVCCTPSQKVLKGYNDMWTTSPELASLLWNAEDGYRYSKGSSKMVDWKCPNCSFKIKNKKISDIYQQSLSCLRCSDGLSYPEKFTYSLIEQLNIEFIKEKTFSWSDGRKYDFYIPSLNCIIEVHGGHHYKVSFEAFGGRSLQEEQENDSFKEKIAKENGIENYITIDCRISDFHYIKESILNSFLNELLNLSNIDWLKCHEYACKSLVKVVSELWGKGMKSALQICENTKISRSATIKYLKQAADLGWCDYDPDKSSELIRKSIVQISQQGEVIKIWDSIIEATNKLHITNIGTSCKGGKRNTAGGYMWMHKEQYDELIHLNKLNEYIEKRISEIRYDYPIKK